MSYPNDTDEKIVKAIELIYGDRVDDLLDDLRFLHEYRLNMKAMGGWVMKGTVFALVGGLVAAAWAGVKLAILKQ